MNALVLTGSDAIGDLGTYVERALHLDADGAVRLTAVDRTLAVYVSPVHGSGGPTVLGLRVFALAEPAEVDVTVSLRAVADRLARLADTPGVLALAVPPVIVTDAGWAGVSPPRSGWQQAGTVPAEVLASAARSGAQEIADGAPSGSGAHAVQRLRALVWAKPVAGLADVASGAAFAADALGFVVGDDEVSVHVNGRWRRLTTARGHVLSRPALL